MRFWLGEEIIWLVIGRVSYVFNAEKDKTYMQPSSSNWFGLQRTLLYNQRTENIFLRDKAVDLERAR